MEGEERAVFLSRDKYDEDDLNCTEFKMMGSVK